MDEEIIKYRKYLYKLIIIENIIITICCTILAIVFNKWWIILISALLYSYD